MKTRKDLFLGGPLRVGLGVALEGPSGDEAAATIADVSSSQIRLELSGLSADLPFEEGDRVRIKYWEEGVIFCWLAEILEVSGKGKKSIRVSVQGEGATVQRRRFIRLPLSIPFSAVVTDAGNLKLLGEAIENAKTQDISLGGLRFETRVPLRAGDKLALKLELSPSHPVSASAWVVRSAAVKGSNPQLHSIGVEFLQLDEQEQRRLLEYLASASQT